MERLFRGKIVKGFGQPERFVPDNAMLFQSHLRALFGQEVEAVVRKYRKTRTDSQNKYLHGCVIPLLAEHCGYEPDEAKDALKARFLTVKGDGPLPKIRRTRDLNTAEMTNFIEQIRRLAAEMGCQIPTPNEVDL